MKRYVINCRKRRIEGIFHDADAAWETAWEQFGHIGSFTVGPA